MNGREIRALRRRLDLTQVELGKACQPKVSQGTISWVETGHYVLPETLESIITALRIAEREALVAA